ncbi:hypothetical protein CLV78_107160 [Aliiruegeria haliotis]|uniref:Uncharacterized protein n=2 Tax=Aliiruegeria haliotis TaxID=1280846 RepID=A0A2T0RM15_9RHOB|nr:hypothetical protein CLV78_107160 [Aliiruegeria haliotis]
MSVFLSASYPSAYFNIYQPGKGLGDTALFSGSIEGSLFNRVLPKSGD